MNCDPVICHYIRRTIPHAVEAYTGGGFDYWLIRVAPFYDVVLVDPDDAGSPSPYPSQMDKDPLTWFGGVWLMPLDDYGNWEDPVYLMEGSVRDCIDFMSRMNGISYDARMEMAIKRNMIDFDSY